jgi:hypothetical protein
MSQISFSPEKRSFDLRELSCSNLGDVFPGIDRSPPTLGYTGNRRNINEFRSDFDGLGDYYISSPSKVPVLGYSGWYRGKHEGRIGKPEIPTESISICDFNAADEESSLLLANSLVINRPRDEVEPSSIESRNLSYELANDESSSAGYNIDRILVDIKQKLDIKYHLLSMKYKYIKKVFTSCDPLDTGYITAYDCRLCISRLNLIIPRVQFLCIMNHFDLNKDGTFAWKKFLKIVCPALQ